MPARNDDLKDRLSRYREINITVTGRKSGRAISIPVWFVLEDDTLYLVPVQGSDRQWYKNVLKNPSIRIKAGGAEAEVRAAGGRRKPDFGLSGAVLLLDKVFPHLVRVFVRSSPTRSRPVPQSRLHSGENCS